MSLHGGLFADPVESGSDVDADDFELDDGGSSSSSSTSTNSSSGSTSTSGIVHGLMGDPSGPDEEPEPERADDDTDTSSSADARRKFREAEQEADTDQPERSTSNDDNSGSGRFLKRAMEEAGGVVDDAAQKVADVTGATEFSESEEAAELREARAEAREEGGIMGRLKAFDASTRAGFDFLLDNPRASVQDTTREGIEATTGVESDEQGEAAAELGQRFNEIVGGAQQEAGEALEGTALDNPVTDTTVAAGEFLAEAIVADPAKALARGATGIDVDEGDEEGTVGAIDAFDIGVTVGTAGAGKAGLSLARGAVRGSDEAGGVLARLIGRGGDDAASIADEAGSGARVLDETTARSTDELLPVLADDATGAGDDLLPRLADDAAPVGDDAAQAADAGAGVRAGLFGSVAAGAARSADEAAGLSGRIGRFVDELTGRAARGSDEAAAGSDDAARLADEGAQLSDEGARLTDEAAAGSDDVARLTDEAAQLSDEAAQVGDEGISVLQRITGSSVVRIGGAVTGGTLAGGALLDALGTFDQLTVTDDQGNEWLLIREKDYPPTQDHRDGGVLWRVEREGQAGSQGYTVMVGADGRNVYILDGAGNRIRAKVDPQTFREAVQRARGAAPSGADEGVA